MTCNRCWTRAGSWSLAAVTTVDFARIPCAGARRAGGVAPLLPKGTIVRLTGYFDTTAANRNISDPRNWSGLGHRSMDQMMFDLGGGYYLTDDEFQQELAKRRERLRLAEGQTVIGCPLCGYGKMGVASATSQQP